MNKVWWAQTKEICTHLSKSIIYLINVSSLVISGEQQLKQFSTFLRVHQSTLNNVISKAPIITTTCAEKNTLHLQPSSSIGLSYGTENISTIDLIQSDNKCLNKIIVVFVELCMEVRNLTNEGFKLLFILHSENTHINHNNYKEFSKISSLLGVLLQAQQLIERSFVVVFEIIKQFTALFDVNSSGQINVDNSSLHFQVCVNVCNFGYSIRDF